MTRVQVNLDKLLAFKEGIVLPNETIDYLVGTELRMSYPHEFLGKHDCTYVVETKKGKPTGWKVCSECGYIEGWESMLD